MGLIACALKGWAIAAVTPAFQTPDEYGHYDYVLYLSYIDWPGFLAGDVAKPIAYNDISTRELWAVARATGTESHLRGRGLSKPLPSLGTQLARGGTFQAVDSHESLRRTTIVAPQFNYPILYYGVAALAVRAMRGGGNPVVSYYVIRTASLGLALLTVTLVWWTATLVVGSDRWLPVAVATAFVALHPQLGMLGTSVQSDALSLSLMALAGAVAALYARQSTARLSLAAGGVVGGLLLTKLHSAGAVAAAFGILIVWSQRDAVRTAARHLATMGVVASVIGGWWYLRAYLLYGSLTGMVGDFRTAHFAGRRANVLAWVSQWQLTLDSFWGMWGWLEVPLPQYIYAGLTALLIISIVPLFGACRHRVSAVTTATLAYWAALGAAYGVAMLAVAAVIGPVHNNQGRHWIPAVVPALALALACSAASLEYRHRRLAVTMFGAWCIALTIATLYLVLEMKKFYGV